MIILGVDPGTASTGFGVIVDDGSRGLYASAYGVVTTLPGQSAERRLAQIYGELATVIREHKPDVVAVEELFFKRNVSTGIAVAQARGVALLAAAHADLAVVGYKPAEVKQAISGVGNAAKDQVRYMTQELLRLDTMPQPDDAADALAVAVCHAHRYVAEMRIAQASATT